MEVRVKKRVKRAGRMEDMGELAIQFGSLEELNGLIERLRAEQPASSSAPRGWASRRCAPPCAPALTACRARL